MSSRFFMEPTVFHIASEIGDFCREFPVTPGGGSRGHQDPTERLTTLYVAVGVGGLGQVEDPVDDHGELA